MVDYLSGSTPQGSFEESFLSTSTCYQTPVDQSLISSKQHKGRKSKEEKIEDTSSSRVHGLNADGRCTIETEYTRLAHEPLEIAAMKTEWKPHIGVKEEANPYLVANRYILNGYRINYTTWRMTLWSLF